MADFIMNESDLRMLDRLQSFLPDKIFDAHVHLHHADHAGQYLTNLTVRYGSTTAQRFLEDQKQLYGDRLVRGLLIPFPTVNFKAPGIPDKANEWILEQVAAAPSCAAEVFVKPGDTREHIESLLVSDRIKGFKCYHICAQVEGSTANCDIGQYLPEVAWQIANERGLVITLHMVKSRSLADEANMAYIKEKTAQYPNAKLILAHCARGFASWTTIEKVRELKGIDNIYYDMAAVCEPATMYEVIRQAGHDKVLWGSDYCIDRVRGRQSSVGMGFTWIYNNDLPEGFTLPNNLVCLESLFAFYQASLMLDLSKEQIQDIFYNNAIRLLGLDD